MMIVGTLKERQIRSTLTPEVRVQYDALSPFLKEKFLESKEREVRDEEARLRRISATVMARLSSDEIHILAKSSPERFKPLTVKATQKGTTFAMPKLNPTREQALARVAELNKELESL